MGNPADAAGAVRRNATERTVDPAVTLDSASENPGEFTSSDVASAVFRAIIDPQGPLRLIILQQILLRLLIEERQLNCGFASETDKSSMSFIHPLASSLKVNSSYAEMAN